MPLIEYPSSDDESTGNSSSALTGVSSPKKRKRDEEIEPVRQPKLPPLPKMFHSLYAASARTHPTDDPALHGGRTRQLPHVEGNWPTHVYLECRSSEFEMLRAIVDAANTNGQVHSLLQSELGARLPLHISLSASLVLKAGQKSAFEEALESKIKESGVGRVETTVHGLRWERNFDGTRWFLVLGVAEPEHNELNRLLHSCNGCVSDFDLPLLYGTELEKPIHTAQDQQVISRTIVRNRSDAFHISIAWQLTEPASKERFVLSHPDVAELSKEIRQFDVVKLKMGNVVKDLRLAERSTVTNCADL